MIWTTSARALVKRWRLAGGAARSAALGGSPKPRSAAAGLPRRFGAAPPRPAGPPRPPTEHLRPCCGRFRRPAAAVPPPTVALPPESAGPPTRGGLLRLLALGLA